MSLDQHKAHKSDEAKKALLYNHWCNFMAETIRARKYRETSWNYISPSKCDIIDWCLKSYKKLQTYQTLLQTGCNATYMNIDTDAKMACFDNYKALNENERKNEPDGKDDFDRHDWKAETDAMAEWERNNLSISPLLRKDAHGKKIPLH